MVLGAYRMSIAHFFAWGVEPLADEVQADLELGMVQPKRSLFYDRSYGAGVPDRENGPVSAVGLVGIKYDVASFVALRNSRVSDGSGGTRDRRVAASQSTVDVTVKKNSGEVGVHLGYILFADMGSMKSVGTGG
jgi:hypothetical protein